MKVLVVDDDPLILVLAERVLGQEGFEVRSAGSAREALSTALADPPDAFLLDVQLDDMDGDVLLSRLRDQPALRGIPAVFLTGTSDPEEVARLNGLGALGVIRKPFDPASIATRLRTLLEES